MEPPAQLVPLSWMVARTGLHRSTIAEAAADGRIPGATKPPGLNRWLFDPVLAEAWIAAGRPTPQQTTPRSPSASCPGSEPMSDHQRREALPSSDSNTPPLVVLFPHAAHRGINDQPAATPARQARRRTAGTRRAALPT